jgi:ABC-type branched-subunit amino acid transport system substrate-binding protein
MADRLRIGACLSLTGRFAQFGRQAALGLEAWRSLDGPAAVIVEDDQSDRRTLEALLPGVAERCDVLLGPYSTFLMRAAGRIAADSGRLIWNHGGSGDDVEQAHPGHVVSVLTPTSRYAEPFLRHIASSDQGPRDLYIVQGPGSFGRQVAEGAATMAQRGGVAFVWGASRGAWRPRSARRAWRLPAFRPAGGVGPFQRWCLRAGLGADRQVTAFAQPSAPGVHGGRRRP